MGMKERSHGNRLGCLYNYIYGSPPKKREEDGNHPIVSYLWFLVLFPSGKCPRLTFWKDIETKEQSPQLPKGRFFFFFFFFLFFSVFTGSLNFPFRVILARWFREPIPQSYHHLFFFFFSKENLAIKGSKAKKKQKKGSSFTVPCVPLSYATFSDCLSTLWPSYCVSLGKVVFLFVLRSLSAEIELGNVVSKGC